MSAHEAEAFEEDPLFDDMLQMRKWDELAKEEGVPLIDLREIKRRIISVLL